MPIPVDAIDGPGRYFLKFVDPAPKQAATRTHPGWEAAVADAVAAQSGLSVSNVVSGSFNHTLADGQVQHLWGVVLDVASPSQTAAFSGGSVIVQPVQFVPLAIAVLTVVAIIGTDLALSHLGDDFLGAVKIMSSDKTGPWTKLAGAARTAAVAAVIFAVGFVALVIMGRGRRWQAA